MSDAIVPSPIHREPQLRGQTVVVIGGSSGIGFETARRATIPELLDRHATLEVEYLDRL